jgi:phosphatidylinositol glycan class O
VVLDDQSECSVPPIDLQSEYKYGSHETGCWHPKTFDKAVVIVVDALRYDFTVPFQPENEEDKPRHFHDALPVFYETAIEHPQNAILLPFIADAPTATLQRLKGLTTGTLPTFIDVGSNFAGTAIEEDNLISQLRNASKRVVHLGDDTWHALFPGHFEPNLTKAYDSFNVWDLHTVDNGVTEHLMPLLHPSNSSKWDVLIGHYLGVDHAGHRYGPDHPAMAAKLRQMDGVFRDVMDAIDDDTLLIVMGDHGMDAKGDHGGESDDEIQAAIWLYSKKGAFGRRWRMPAEPPLNAKLRSIAQIDFVPTFSLLMGLPIPFNNLGAPLAEAFIGSKGIDFENLARVNRIAAAQIQRYMKEYALARRLDEAALAHSQYLWGLANRMWERTKTDAMGEIEWDKNHAIAWNSMYSAYYNYQDENIRVCRALWARFDVPSMINGIFVLTVAVALLGVYSRSLGALRLALSPGFVKRGGLGMIAGALIGFGLGHFVPAVPTIHATVFAAALGGSAGIINVFYKARKSLMSPFPRSIWAWVSVIFTVALSFGFAANSFTIWEDNILMFFLSSIGVMLLVSSIRQEAIVDRALGCYHSVLFIVLTRLASLSRLCREEQMPYCVSTYYASSSSSTSAVWQLTIPFVLAFVLPGIVKQYYHNTNSYHHSALLWIGVGFRAALCLGAIFWSLDAADDKDIFGASNSSTLKTIKVILSQIVLGIAIPVGYSIYAWAAPFLAIRATPRSAAAPARAPGEGFLSEDGQSRLAILGYGNAHGSRYFILVTMWASAIILLQKPMGAGAIGILLWQIMSLLEIFHANKLQDSAIGPITLALLGSFHFFKTGHQATMSSIQWESAFIPLKTITYPWSPILIVLNTFGAQILTVLAVPAIILWKAPPKKKGLLADVAKAMATHLLFYAVVSLATAAWAGWLRRHLMLYRIFSPRFMMGALVLVIVDIFGILFAVGGTRWSFLSVGDVFGFQ